MLEAKKLNFGIKDVFQKEISFKISRGEIITIQGKSGSGKSTLLSTISGFLPPFSGKLIWENENLLDKPPWKRPFSLLFQEGNLFDHLNIQMNIQLGINPSGKISASEKILISKILNKLEIDNLTLRMPNEISGGQQQRVALARTILRKDPVLLMDEPFASLDKKTRLSALNLVLNLTKKYQLAVLIVTHDEEDSKLLNARNFYL